MTSIVLLVAACLPAVPPDSARPIPVQLKRGQEFIYHARHTQESDRPGSGTSQILETRVFILDHGPRGTLAAFMTTHQVDARGGAASVPVVRLELGRIDASAHVALLDPLSTLPRVPIDAPPTLETLPFLELPHVEPDRPWIVADSEMGDQTWRVLITEFHKFGRCLRVKGEQSSGTHAVANRPMWKREEIASVLLNEGIVARMERSTQWQFQSGDSFRSTTVIELDSLPAEVPPEEFKARQAEIVAAVRFGRELAELLKPRGEPNLRGYDELLRAIERHPDKGTPYFAAIRWIRNRAELARSGERPPEPIVIAMPRNDGQARGLPPRDVGQPIHAVRLKSADGKHFAETTELVGRPSVLVFFRARSSLNPQVLEYVQAAADAYAERVGVYALALDLDGTFPTTLKSAQGISLPVYDGRELMTTIAGSSTPRIVVLDSKGNIRVIAPGWGREYSEWLHKELVSILKEK